MIHDSIALPVSSVRRVTLPTGCVRVGISLLKHAEYRETSNTQTTTRIVANPNGVLMLNDSAHFLIYIEMLSALLELYDRLSALIS